MCFIFLFGGRGATAGSPSVPFRQSSGTLGIQIDCELAPVGSGSCVSLCLFLVEEDHKYVEGVENCKHFDRCVQ